MGDHFSQSAMWMKETQQMKNLEKNQINSKRISQIKTLSKREGIVHIELCSSTERVRGRIAIWIKQNIQHSQQDQIIQFHTIIQSHTIATIQYNVVELNIGTM